MLGTTKKQIESFRAGAAAYKKHYEAVDAGELDEYPLPTAPPEADKGAWTRGWSDTWFV